MGAGRAAAYRELATRCWRKYEVSKVDTAIARRRLQDMRADLDRSITVLDPGAPAVAQAENREPQDMADVGTSLSEGERAQAALSVVREQLGQVTQALERLDAGSYGTCVDCGGAVPDGRLEAKPEAARCVSCQERHDRSRR